MLLARSIALSSKKRQFVKTQGLTAALLAMVDKAGLKAESVRRNVRYGVDLRISTAGEKLAEAARQVSGAHFGPANGRIWVETRHSQIERLLLRNGVTVAISQVSPFESGQFLKSRQGQVEIQHHLISKISRETTIRN